MAALKESSGSVEGASMIEMVVIAAGMTLLWLALVGLAASSVFATRAE